MIDQAEIHEKAISNKSEDRQEAARLFKKNFSMLPDKAQAWQDLLRLTQDFYGFVRWKAAEAIGFAFPYFPDRVHAWQDLRGLMQDSDAYVRWGAAISLGSAFPFVPSKIQSWQDLLRLTKDYDSYVRSGATRSLGSAFPNISDKCEAWQILHDLTQDLDRNVRSGAAESLGSAYPYILDKDLAWQDLHRLTQDPDSIVRKFAYHSLGRASIFKATAAENREVLLSESKIAIGYFEKSSQVGGWSPAKFCLPFYRSYFAIIFHEAKGDEILRYLEEAKKAIGSSKSKAELIEAVANLAKALQESQKLKNRSFEEIADELNAYRRYCEKAAEQMTAAEETTPGVVKLMRKCSPLLEETIQAPISEIQKSARLICQTTRNSGTQYEIPCTELQKAAMDLSKIDLINIQKCSSRIVWQLTKFCSLLPAKDREQVCDIIEEIEHERDLPEKLYKIMTALLCLGPILEDKSTKADIVILTTLLEEYGRICNQISDYCVPFNMGSAPSLCAWKFGNIYCRNFDGYYKVAVGMIGRAGTTQGALATREAVQLWKPRYIIFSGIAGGLPDPEEIDSHPKLGDVVIADTIYGYEYGKIATKFEIRGNWTYRTDQALLNSAAAYGQLDRWKERIKVVPPEECMPSIIGGEIASGDKVIDNPSNQFFKQVLKMWPKVKAVEMEGAGAASAIEQIQSIGLSTGFMMIRGISDLPRAIGKNKGTKERDAWKAYASDTAAAFVVGWISDGLPIRPSPRNSAD